MAGQGIERIPDSLGYLVLTEDGAVVSVGLLEKHERAETKINEMSGGDLENDETVATKISKMVLTAVRLVHTSEKKDAFKRLSVVYDNFLYAATVSNHRVLVSKRKYVPQDPVAA